MMTGEPITQTNGAAASDQAPHADAPVATRAEDCVRSAFSYPSADGRSQVHAVWWLNPAWTAVVPQEVRPHAVGTPSGNRAVADPAPQEVRSGAAAPEPVGNRSAAAAAPSGSRSAAPACPRAVVQIVHGMSEFIERYDEFAAYLVRCGYAVCGEDHIGHGATAPTKDDWGVLPAYGGVDILLADVKALHDRAAERFPGVPLVIYGHSMGSFIARAYVSRYGDGVSAAVFSGTASTPPAVSKFARGLSRHLAQRKGERYVSTFVDGLGAGSYGKKIPNARTPFDWLSTDPAVVDAYIADERCGFPFSVGGYATLTDLTALIDSPACAQSVPKDLPLLFVAGAEDPVGNCGKGVNQAADLVRRAGVRTVDVKIYPGMRHEIHNEPGRAAVFSDISNWIGEVL
jgi:alpha-beta hydrolase superfamily lysophospholipase